MIFKPLARGSLPLVTSVGALGLSAKCLPVCDFPFAARRFSITTRSSIKWPGAADGAPPAGRCRADALLSKIKKDRAALPELANPRPLAEVPSLSATVSTAPCRADVLDVRPCANSLS